MKTLNKSLLFFLLVGSAAAFVHLVTVISIVEIFKLNPLYANVIGFLVAFNASYFGHHHFTFEGHGSSHKQAAPKFFLVALTSFCLNQGLFYILFRLVDLNYIIALFIVLIAVAIFTFLSSKFWAYTR